MTEGPGRATGPQRRPRRQAGAVVPADTPQVAPRRPGSERTDEERRQTQYTASTTRIFGELEQALARMEEFPEAAALRGAPQDELLLSLDDLERKATILRMELDQMGCAL